MSRRIDKLFDEVAERYPNKDAVVDCVFRVSYSELKILSDNIAGNLINSGVTVGEIIGISLPRSVNYVAAILGILKSGAAYLPLISNQNNLRTDHIIRDSKPKIIITNDTNFYFPSSDIKNINTLISETDRKDIQTSMSDLIYVMYTSGSTGQPKGVMIEHRNVHTLLKAFENLTGSGQSQNGMTICPFTFDVSVWEIFSMLCFGGTLFIPDESEIIDEKYLSDFISKNKITNLYIPPSFVDELANELRAVHYNQIKRVLVGVEPIMQNTLQNLKDSNQDAIIINGYGPTETTICASFYKFEKMSDTKAVTPIGKAVEGNEICILDEKLKEVQRGEKGQICIAGESVGRGYLNNPELTNEKFIQSPFDANNRMYLSGDYGFVNGDGDLVFVGREDGQVKIRGYRVEVGEVEHNLKAIESVTNTVVIVDKDEEGINTLNAFVVSEGMDEIAIRKELLDLLPEYMVPDRIFVVDSIPVTAEGKTDKPKLISLLNTKPEKYKSVDELSGTEEIVYSIFREVLKRENISANSNFFELGGNSLSATRVIARVNKQFKTQLPIKTLYTNPDIVSLSTIIIQSENIIKSEEYIPESRYADEYPLSVNQQRPWVIFKYDTSITIYNIQNVFKISGNVTPSQLEIVLNKIVSRHDALRTEFLEIDDIPIQRVLKNVSFEIKMFKCENADSLDSMIREVTRKDNEPFDLTKSPLFRFSCIEHSNILYLIFTVHHIIADGWSIAIFIEDLAELLKSNEAPDIPYQYRDYVEYQEKFIQSEKYKNDFEYLLNELRDVPLYLNFPTDFIRKNNQTFEGDDFYFDIDEVLFNKIKKFCLRKNITPYMFFYSCFSCLVFRYSSSNNFILGSIIAGRDRQEFEKTFGFLSNTLLVKNEIRINETIESLLDSVKEQSLDMYQFQNIPNDQIVEKLCPVRDLSYNPVFQIAFNYQNMPLKSSGKDEINIEPMYVNSGNSMLDLTLTLRESEKDLSGYIEFSTVLFKKETIENLSSNYRELIKSFLEEQDKKLNEVNFQSDSELEKINHFSKSDFVSKGYKSVSEIIDEVCDKYENMIAVHSNENSLTYKEMKNSYDKITTYLIKHGIINQRIILCLNRSVELLPAILGIIRSGNAYVPIDPEYMTQRIDEIVSVAKPAIIICDEMTSGLFENYSEKVLTYSSIVNEQQNETGLNLNYPEKDSIAYVMFTSGTTGKPKGVEIKNESLSLFVSAAIENYNVTSDDRVLQFSSIGFDISVEEIFVTLSAGASLVLRNDEMIYSHRSFFEFVSKHKLCVVSLPTTFWQELIYALKQDSVSIPSSLRLVIVGGEVINPKAVKIWFEISKNPPTLLNTYGPTEATVVAAFHEVTNQITDNIPIGKPFGAAELVILDDFGNTGVLGLPGELHIAGDILSSGYINDDEADRERFKIINGKRYYATGDICKLSSYGNFYFIERKDRQVKVRGFRVEPEEIERVMMSNENVADCIVASELDVNGDTKLCLYYKSELNEADLKKYLEKRLSSFMIPEKFVKVESIPRNENGKVLYEQLKKVSTGKIKTETSIKPESELEQKLIEIWKKVLNINQFSDTDNFFSLGGNSLKAIRLMSLINSEFGKDIPLAELFRNSTLRQMAKVLSEEVPDVNDGVIVPMKTSGSKFPLYCIHGVGGNVLEFEPLTNVIDADQPVYGIQSFGLDKLHQPAKSIEEMAERYVNEIIAHNPDGPYLLCGSSLGGWIGFEMVNRFREKGKEVVFLGMFDTIAFRFHADKNFISKFILRIWFSIKRILYNLKVFIVAPVEIKKSNLERILKSTRRRLKYFIWKSRISKYQATDEKLPEYLIEVENANAKAAESYVIKPKDVKIDLFRAENKTFYIEDFEYLGWKGLAERGITIHDVPGDHNSILKYPNVKVLAIKLEQRLNEINEKNS